MITLAIETSTSHGSVAVHDGERLRVERRFVADRSHSATLFARLQEVLRDEDNPEQIAVGLGPGSYAGVRIAISAAMGLQLAFGSQLVGLPSVAALSVAVERYVCVGDARRETYYWTEVERGICLEGPRLVSRGELYALLERNELPLFGTERLADVPQVEVAGPSASLLAELAASGRGITAKDNLEPIYLREPQITLPKPARASGT